MEGKVFYKGDETTLCKITLLRCVFKDCGSEESGGAMHLSHSLLRLSFCKFDNCQCSSTSKQNMGGIFLFNSMFFVIFFIVYIILF
jgi:hypothetical protein